MARINTYNQDQELSENDKLLGSDTGELKPTKNYSLGQLRNFFLDGVQEEGQNNKPVLITLPQITAPNQLNTVLQDVADLVNSLLELNVSSTEIPFFSLRRGSRLYILTFQGIGKGIYGVNGTQLLPSNFQVISEKFLDLNNITQESTTEIINLFNIGAANIEDVVNASTVPIIVKPLQEGFTIFRATQDGEGRSWLYQGDSGSLGLGLQQTTSDDFDLINTTTTTGEANLEEDVPTDLNVGGSEANTIIPEGLSFTEYVKLVHQTVFFPELQNPTFSLSSNAGSLRVIGSSFNLTLTYNFNRGSILGDTVGGFWDDSVSQNPRAGAANFYVLDSTNTGTTNTRTFTHVVTQGSNSFSGSVDYAQGAQPLDSKNNAFNTPLVAGNVSRSTSFEGVYPLFATTSNITTLTQQSIVSMLNANNIQFNLVAETTSDSQKFEIPDAWLSNRSLSSVQYFNTVSGSFDTDNKISDFDVTSVNKTIEGNTVGYKQYTHNGARRSNLLIRIIF